MRISKLALVLSSLVCFCTTAVGAQSATTTTKLEAESATIPLNSKVTIKHESGMSNGGYVELVQESGQQRNSILVFEDAVTINEPGMYQFKIGYKTVEGNYKKQLLKLIDPMSSYEVDLESKVLKNEIIHAQHSIEFPGSSVWTEKEVIIPIEKTGTLDLQLQGDWAWMDVDYISFNPTPVVVSPTIDILDTHFYKSNPTDITFRYENYYNTFEGIKMNGTFIDSTYYTVDESTKTICISQDLLLESVATSGTFEVIFKDTTSPSFTFKILAQAPTQALFQAEDTCLLSGTKVLTDAATETTFIQMENSGGIHFALNAPTAGRYDVVFRFRSPHGDKAQRLTVSNSESTLDYGVGFPITPFTISDHTSDNSWEYVSTNVYLAQGFNQLSFTKQHGWMDLDFVRIGSDATTLKPSPTPATLSPSQDTVSLDAPRDLLLHLQLFGRKLTSITTIENQPLAFETTPYTTTELDSGFAYNAIQVYLKQETLTTLAPGIHELLLTFDDGSTLTYTLTITKTAQTSDLEIVSFEVGHGNATLIKLPNGKNILVDSAKPKAAASIVLPYLENNNIELDYYLLTHYHDDHSGLLPEILATYNLQTLPKETTSTLASLPQEERYALLKETQFLDNTMLLPHDDLNAIWDLGDTSITILNSCLDANGALLDDLDENNTSIAFMLDYNGFKYLHNGDVYAKSHERMVEIFGQDYFQVDYFQGNHHFHGSVSVDFMRNANPTLVFVPANGAVFARGAFTTLYEDFTEHYLKSTDKNLKDTLVSCETGSVIVKVNTADDWWYETYSDISTYIHP